MARKQRKIDSGLKWGEGYVNKRTDADGAVIVQARWPEGEGLYKKWRAKTFRGDDAQDRAEDHLREIARKKRAGTYAEPSRMTVTDLLNTYLDRGEGRWSPHTLFQYRRIADNHIIPRIGTLRVAELTARRLQQWIDTMRREVPARRKEPLSSRHIVGIHRVLSAALHEAVRLEVIVSNPASSVRLPAPRNRKPATWTETDVQKVLADLHDKPMWNALYRVALITGMRPGELRGLTWDCIDVTDATIHVFRTMSKDADGKKTLGETTKTREARMIAVTVSVIQALQTWKKVQNAERLKADSWDSRGFVFTGMRNNGQFLDEATWFRYHRELIARTGVPRITLHGLRHTNATLELAAGTHPKLVADRLGHRRIETTINQYSHVSAELQRSVVEALEQRIEAATDTTTLVANIAKND